MHRNLAWAAEVGVALLLVFAFLYTNCGAESSSPSNATYTIEATATGNGSISPLDVTTVNYWDSITYTMTPGEFGELKSVTVDGTVWWSGTSLVAMTYVFNHVRANHTIVAAFNSPS